MIELLLKHSEIFKFSEDQILKLESLNNHLKKFPEREKILSKGRIEFKKKKLSDTKYWYQVLLIDKEKMNEKENRSLKERHKKVSEMLDSWYAKPILTEESISAINALEIELTNIEINLEKYG
jgi:hypothetical protein